MHPLSAPSRRSASYPMNWHHHPRQWPRVVAAVRSALAQYRSAHPPPAVTAPRSAPLPPPSRHHEPPVPKRCHHLRLPRGIRPWFRPRPARHAVGDARMPGILETDRCPRDGSARVGHRATVAPCRCGTDPLPPGARSLSLAARQTRVADWSNSC